METKMKQTITITFVILLFAWSNAFAQGGANVPRWADDISATLADGTGEIDTTLENTRTAVGRSEIQVDSIENMSTRDWQHLTVVTGLQSIDSTWSSIATHEVFTITGAIEFEIFGWCNVDWTGGDSIHVNFAGQTEQFVSMLKNNVDQNEIMTYNAAPSANVAWVTNIADLTTNLSSVNDNAALQPIIKGIRTDGADFGYEIQTASAPAGQATFVIKWRSLNTIVPATVVAGAGGTL